MKLLRVEVENYGLFSGQSFEFDSNFALVFGPNEAGKSTLLQLIREQLFGFKHQNPFSFANHSGKMAAEAELELSDGQRLRYRRQKGRPDAIKGELLASGKPMDAMALASLFGGMTRERYEQLFGFSLRELTAGQESLDEANIGEALYGGALGSLSGFQHVRSELQTEADALLTERGRKKIIDGILGNIKEQTKLQREAAVKPAAYKHLAKECEAAAAAVESTRTRVDQLRREAAHLDRIAAAIGPWLRHCQAAEALTELRVPPDFPLDGADQLQRLKTRRAELNETLQDIEGELQADTSELTELELAPEVVANEAQIRLLQQQIKQIESCRVDSQTLRRDAQAIVSSVAARLRELHPEWDHSHLDRFESTLVQRERIEGLERDREELDRERSVLAGERRAIEAGLNALRQQLEQISETESTQGLDTLLDLAPAYQRNQDRLLELREQAAELDEHLDTAIAKLNAPVGGSLLIDAALPVPMEATVLEFRERWSRIEDELREAQRHRSGTERELADKQAQLGELESRWTVPDREQLLAQRQHRDTGWRILRQKFVDDEAISDEVLRDWLADSTVVDVPELPAALGNAYERSVSAADEVADERQEKYEQAAKRDQLTDEISRLQKRLASETQLAQQKEHQQTDERVSWVALWEACPFEPLSPDAMLGWLRDYETLGETNSQRRLVLRQIEELQVAVSEFESRLAESFPGNKSSASALLSKTKQLANAAHEATVRRKTFEEQVPQKQQALQAVDESLAELEARDSAWQASWQALLDEFSFPHEWDVQLAAKILAGLSEARSNADKAKSLDQRVAEMQNEVATFESQVHELCGQIATGLQDFLAEHAIGELFDRLASAKQAQRDHDRLQQSTGKLRKRLTDTRGKHEQTERDISSLLAAAGAESEHEFEQTAVAAERFAELSRVRDEAAHDIKTIRATEDADTFTEELRGADPDSVAAEQGRLATDSEHAERDFDEALRQHTLKENERGEMQGGSRAAELAQDLESTRGELANAIDRWAPMVLAQAVMKRAIDKFAADHQPAVMADVGRLLRQMTLGRYIAIDRKLDERGTLLVVDDCGDRKEPQQLSTGTREQLYLAIRLAYIQHYCRDTEPLPIVMDDVLVNFDAERAKQTLKVLAEVASGVQIIFLTCHEHMVRLAQEALPSCEPIVLPGGGLATGSVSTSRVAKATVVK